MRAKLGIVAGGGDLPARLIAHCEESGRPYFVLAMEEQTDPALVAGSVPHAWTRLGALGTAFRLLRDAGVEEVVMAGAMKRPSMAALRPDIKAMAFLVRTGALKKGDDGLLRAVVRMMESEGFRVVGVDDVLPDVVAAEGVLGSFTPDDAANADIAVGIAAAKELGARDIGQGVVVRGGTVIAREAADGTDAMLSRCAPSDPPSGVLVKVKKPEQEQRADLPAVGVGTVESVRRAGLAGIAVEAGGAVIVDRAAVTAAADAAGVFVAGVPVVPVLDRSRTVFLIAGEPSGDALGARLMAAIRERAKGPVLFRGIGGEGMIAEGLDPLFPMHELSVMGLAEVLPRLPRLIRRIGQTATAIRGARPDVVVTIDSPDFCLRVAKRLRGSSIPVVHYVAPSVWAWRPGRARTIAQRVDHLLALLPFEPPYFEAEGLDCTFVGHPIVETAPDRADGGAFRAEHGIRGDAPLLCVLPGSRRGEVSRLLPIFSDAVGRLHAGRPDLRVVIPVAETVAEMVAEMVADWPVAPILVRGATAKQGAFAAADAALAASGTVALELAMAGVAAVIAYRVNAVTAFIVRRLIRVRFANLVNILLDREAVPEFIQDNCRPDLLASALESLLADPRAREAQAAAGAEAMRHLGAGGPSPSRRAAEAVLGCIPPVR